MASSNSVEEFLAREQEQLAGIDDEFGALSNGGSTTAVNGFPEQPSDVPEIQEEKTEEEKEAAQINGTEQDTPQSPLAPSSISALPLQQQTAMRRAPSPTPTRDEPAKVKAWREEQKERLEKKDQNEENEKKKLREQAKRELDEWYQKRNEQLEKAMKQNRVLEQELTQERDSAESGQEWERIAGLCDFSSKSARGSKDMTRFRSILLQMKNKPPKASSK